MKHDGSVRVDLAGRIQAIDESLCTRITGLRPNDLLNLPLDSFIAPDEREPYRDWLDATVQDAEAHQAIHLLADDGTRLLGEVSRVVDRPDVESDAPKHHSAREVLLRLAAAVSSPIGDDFMRSLILEACDTLDVAGAMIARPDSASPNGVHSWAYVLDGQVMDNVRYELTGTPCELVLYGDGIVCPSGIQVRFPEDDILAQLGLQSYAGAPLCASTGEHLGLLSIFDKKPMRFPGTMKSAVEILAARVTSELERRNVEQHLRRTRRMESLGQLAGGIAHDFNNILTVIMSTTDLLLDGEPQDKDLLEEDIRAIRQAASSAADLTRKLLSFGRRQTVSPSKIDLNARIQEVFDILGRLVSTNVDLRFALDPSAGHVLLDPDQLEQLLFNLVANANDAMPDGGSLEISTQRVELENIDATDMVLPVEPGTYAVVSVRDSGHGLPPGSSTRIFEPFYTTRRTNGGTGLGLATVYGVTKQVGGGLRVQSSPGHGATFEILLRSVEAPRPKTATLEQREQTQKALRILVVEDEVRLGRAAQRMLVRQGHEVVLHSSPSEALAEFKRAPDDFDLLLTDIVMPDMSGFELARKARRLNPDIDLVFMSGYSNPTGQDRADFGDSSSFLRKPFGHDELMKVLSATSNPPLG